MNAAKLLRTARKVLHDFSVDPRKVAFIDKVSNMIVGAFAQEKRILICGNGGSMCDAMHFAEEWTGKFRRVRRPLPAIALSDPAHITCVANDFGFEHIFSRQVEALGNSGDILIVLSTSGNSANVLRAIEAGKKNNIQIVGLSGRTGGEMESLCNLCLLVPADTSDRIQEIHMLVLHIIIELVENKLFGA